MGENNFIPLKPRLSDDYIPTEGEIRTSEEIGAIVGWEGNWIWSVCCDCGRAKWSHCIKGKPASQRCLKCGHKHRVSEHNKKFPTTEEIAQYSPQLGDIRYSKYIGLESGGYWEWYACDGCKKQDWIRTKKGMHQKSYICLECFKLSRAIKPLSDNELSLYIPQIGDIRHRKALGLGEKGKVIWNACAICGKTRWSRLVKGKPETTTCLDCDRIRSSNMCKSMTKTPYLTLDQLKKYTPNIGDILHAREIGRKGNSRFLYNKCTTCNNGFWIILRNGIPRTNQCYSCSKYNKKGKFEKAYKLLEECTTCHNIYPATLDYFRKGEGVYSGIRTTCKECQRIKGNTRCRIRRQTDPIVRLNSNMNTYLYLSLRKYKNSKRWQDLVGYTTDELKEHLENNFTEGMSWDNYGNKHHGWHVHHLIPISLFNYTTPNDYDFRRCWDKNNLVPLWGKDNISLGNKIDHPFQPALAIQVRERRLCYGT
jgi:hypothetical protein